MVEPVSEDTDRSPHRLDVGQPDTPEPDAPDTPKWRPIKNGATWGAIAGFALGNLIMSSLSIQTPFGAIYGGDHGLALFAFWIGLGSALGAGIGWAYTKIDDYDPPPS